MFKSNSKFREHTMKNISRLLLVTGCFCAILLAQNARAQYLIRHGVFGSGGAILSDNDVRIKSTAGQSFVGITANSAYKSKIGFWFLRGDILTGIDPVELSFPKDFRLEQNFPNPFNPGTLIKYQLPEPASVSLTVYNILGQKVRTLVYPGLQQAAGAYQVEWDGRDNVGAKAAGGVYFYRMEAKTANTVIVQVRKMMLVK
jgi:hypothetical protein